jgi:transposase InsO family protein
VPSLGKKRFICVIVDDYSRYTWIIFLSQKSDTYANFVEYCNRFENEKGLKINTIRSDHGGEFENAQFDDLCSKRGYRYEYSAPRTPQQNEISFQFTIKALSIPLQLDQKLIHAPLAYGRTM